MLKSMAIMKKKENKMGLRVSVKMVVGIRIDTSKAQIRQKSFSHDYPEDWLFDPKTGEELREEVSAIDEEWAKEHGLDFVTSYSGDQYCILGKEIGHHLGDSYKAEPLNLNIEKLTNEVWEKLQKTNLKVTKKSICLWSVAYTSY